MLSGLPLWFLLVSLAILGAIWGSFVAALCSRWPKGESIATGRSHCDQCGKVIAGYDLVPVVSYLALKGRCRNCGQEFGIETIAIELVSASIGAASVLIFLEGQALAAAIFGWLLLPLIILDYSHFWLPNRLVLLLAVAGLFVGPMLLPEVMLVDRVIAASSGFLCLEAIRLAYEKYRQQEGLGAGDPKLFGALGLWLGWEAMPTTLLLASVIGLSVALLTRQLSDQIKSAFPFGSYLAVAAFAASWIELSIMST